MRTCLPLVTILALAGSVHVAAAQPATAQAESLFRDGKRLMGEGKLAEACDAFEGSYRKDPATSTLLNVADCREKNGQFSTAWGAFVEAERRSRGSTDPAQQAINNLARDRAAKLEPRISYLTINIPDASRVDGLTLTRNGEPLDDAEWNRSLPADIGTHVIEAKAPGYEPWRTTVVIGAEKEKQAVTVPEFKALPKPPKGALGPSIEVVDASPFTAKRKLAIGLAGLGVVGVGLGIGLYVTANNQYDEAVGEPDDTKQNDLYNAANQKYLIAQIAGGVGVAALGAATFLWLTGKPRVIEHNVTVAPTIRPGFAGLAAVGSF
ncbi:MAG: hypothetical protein R3B06_00020 [Kofleriaceae bacterium]